LIENILSATQTGITYKCIDGAILIQHSPDLF